jgi:Zn ribbon nucleic-acid-binding protein
MDEALLGVVVVVVVLAIAEIAKRRRKPAKCPRCASHSLLVLGDSNTMRECGDCGHIFSL